MQRPWLQSYRRLIPSLRPIVRKVTLTRTETSNEGTFGIVKTDSGLSLYSGELPWRQNAHGISCVPALVCVVQRIVSPKHGPCYCLTDVPGGRTMCEFHKGNFCGDISKFFKSDVEGCIVLGNALGVLAGQACVINSKDAIARFEADLECLPFQLTITWGPGLESTETGMPA